MKLMDWLKGLILKAPDLLAGQDSRLTKAACRIANAVKKQNKRALLVGGFVRDALLGIKSKDADMEVYGLAPAKLESLLNKLFPGRVEEVGKAFGVLKIPLGNGLDIDVAIPRRESKTGQGHKGFLIQSDPAMSVEQAARRRDFTINSISLDPLTGELIDPCHGQKDLAKKILRATDLQTFGDDPLRVYRAVQFTARLGLKIESKTEKLLKQMVDDGALDELPSERVTEEIKKLLLKAPRPSVGFELMDKLGIIDKYYPELASLQDTPQEPEWHPEGNVWIHTMMVLDRAAAIISQTARGFNEEQKLQVMLGALCHDLGKASTTALGEKAGVPRIRALGHEEAGVEPAKKVLVKWSFGHEIYNAVLLSTVLHMQPHVFAKQAREGKITEDQIANGLRRLIKKIHPVSWRVILAVTEADFRGRLLPDVDGPYECGEIISRLVKKYSLDKEPTKPLIQGRDLLKKGIEPGPRMGQIIQAIENARDQGKIRTRQAAFDFLDQLIK